MRLKLCKKRLYFIFMNNGFKMIFSFSYYNQSDLDIFKQTILQFKWTFPRNCHKT